MTCVSESLGIYYICQKWVEVRSPGWDGGKEKFTELGSSNRVDLLSYSSIYEVTMLAL